MNDIQKYRLRQQSRKDSRDAAKFQQMAKIYKDIAGFRKRRADRLDARERLDYGVKGMKWGEKKQSSSEQIEQPKQSTQYKFGFAKKAMQDLDSFIGSDVSDDSRKAIKDIVGKCFKWNENSGNNGIDTLVDSISDMEHMAKGMNSTEEKTINNFCKKLKSDYHLTPTYIEGRKQQRQKELKAEKDYEDYMHRNDVPEYEYESR